MTDEKTITHTPESESVGAMHPDLTASLVTEQDGKKVWRSLFEVNLVKVGYYKGLDSDDNTIIVETQEAKFAQREQTPSPKSPALYIYREAEVDGETTWIEILVAWRGKKDGYFTGKTAEGHSVVIQTAQAKAASFEHKPKRITPVDLSPEADVDTATED